MGEQTDPRERVRDSSDPWRPTPQPECEPGCTCTGSFEVENDRLTAYLAECRRAETSERRCTEADPCSFCGPVERFWAGDPSPVAEPPEPSERVQRAVTGNIPGRGTQVTVISTPDSPSDFLRIYTATRKDRA